MEFSKPVDSPLRYLGGKSKMREQIVRLIPDDHKCYVEAFGGGGWVLLAKPRSKSEIYNDLHGELVNFFRVIRTAPKAFIEYIVDAACPSSRELFKRFREEDAKAQNEIERAFRYYYVNRTSFAGMNRNYGVSTTRAPSIHLPDRITYVSERLQKVVIENLDFRALIPRYDRKYTFFYLDPPYDTPTSKGYEHWFERSDFEELRAMLEKMKGRFLMSLNDTEFVRETFGDFEIAEINTVYSTSHNMTSDRRVTELLISNYKLDREALRAN